MVSVKRESDGEWAIAPEIPGTHSLTLQGSKDAKTLKSSVGGRDLGDFPEFAQLGANALRLGRLDYGSGPDREVTNYTILGEPNEILKLNTVVEIGTKEITLTETYKVVLKEGALETIEPEDVLDREKLFKYLAVGARYIMRNAPETLVADKELMMAAVAEDPHCLSCVAEPYRSTWLADKDVMMAAFSSKTQRISGKLLEDAAEPLRADKDVVMAAVTCQESGVYIKYASESLRADEDVRAAAQSQYSGDISTIV